MADVLDINDAVELDVDEDGDQSVLRLKDKVTKRKGRGFVFGGTSRSDKVRHYESVDGGEGGEALGPQKSVEGWILFVTSVHEEASDEDLHEKFSEYGLIKNINLNLDRRTGFLKGYALVEYANYAEADTARKTLDGSEILGQTIGVDWCFVKGAKRSKRSSRRSKY